MPHSSEECSKVVALISEYLDLELPPEACRAIESHFANCPACEELADSIRRTVALCHEYQTGTMPSPLSATTRARLKAAWRKMGIANLPDR